MALVVETNILLYAVNRGCPECESCVDFLRELVATGDTCFVRENVSAHARTRNPADRFCEQRLCQVLQPRSH
jgi:hypothetical protein